MQNLFVVLAGIILGPIRGTAAVGLFLLAGIFGAPVFAGFTGGITHLAGPTGGYLAGYVLAAFTAGLIAGQNGISTIRIIIAAAAGFLIIYLPGIIWLKIITNMNWDRAVLAGMLPFLPGDIVKGAAAVLIAKKVKNTILDHLNE